MLKTIFLFQRVDYLFL